MQYFRSVSLIAGSMLTISCATPPRATDACDNDYAAIKAEEMRIIDEGMRVYAEVDEADATPAERAALEQTMTLLESRSRPVDAADVAIIDRARQILSNEANWDRADDRECSESDTTFSLYCALYFASEEVVGEYQHRRTALQEVRFALEDATQGREYEHRLRDFNNDPSTSLADIHAVLDAARMRINERLALQEACAL